MTTPQPTHYEVSLQRDIERIRSKVLQMSGMCERALQSCLQILRERNRQLAYSVILRDQHIDELEKEIDQLCQEFLVRQQPVAGPLRFVYSTIKINLELERVGDYAESIARQSLKLTGMDILIPLERFEEMARLSIPMLHDAIRAFVDQDAELARRTMELEEAVDALKSQLNADVVKLFRENRLPFEALNPLIMIARRFERVSDQARNICMEVLYMCTGQFVKHAGQDVFRVLFVDEHNACRSLMAEAVATSLQQPKFVFSSAGLDPRPADGRTAAFLQRKGLDVSRMVPRALHEVPSLDQYHVIVVLAREAQRAFPPRPRKVVFLDWNIPDPSGATGTAEEVEAAFESAYGFLTTHIRDLVDAILDQD